MIDVIGAEREERHLGRSRIEDGQPTACVLPFGGGGLGGGEAERGAKRSSAKKDNEYAISTAIDA